MTSLGTIGGRWVALLALACPVVADGGTVRLHERVEPFVVTVFSAPTPLRAGVVDVSVMVQDASTDELRLDATVTGRVGIVGEAGSIPFAATRAAATNRLLYAASVELPRPGTWRFVVTVAREGTTCTVEGTWEIGEPLPAWTAYWAWLALPVGFLALFGVHQALRERSGERRSPVPTMRR